ncbi:Bifunctional inhibitor/lipid-transfer protein/seed storage 2S albumin superfamily protein [Raphanus sativus]|nr:Bifunctional inhibitor/lipid-transfer protein/seed storage 2S albumin superfamily protein [Raphanus sativus]
MAISSRVFTGIVMILVISGELIVPGKGTCQGDIEGLMRECAVYVQRPGPKVNPSAGCCSVVKRSDVGCACGRITASVQKMIDMDKVVHVTAFCGKPLSHGTKCGSKSITS